MSSRREAILSTAVRLFSANGYHATGIDRVIKESGVAKMTLYNHFGSKEELILAALRRWDEDSRRWLMNEINARGTTPRERLLVLFDVLDEWFDQQNFKGCMFINATAEYSDPDDPIHAAAAEHKRLFRRFLRDQVAQLGVENIDQVTDQMALLMEGAIVTTQVHQQRGAGQRAKSVATALLDAVRVAA
ncbi:MAG: TetR/AcrR family transcriptional regulator [Gammaproteobacteria bacterium]